MSPVPSVQIYILLKDILAPRGKSRGNEKTLLEFE